MSGRTEAGCQDGLRRGVAGIVRTPADCRVDEGGMAGRAGGRDLLKVWHCASSVQLSGSPANVSTGTVKYGRRHCMSDLQSTVKQSAMPIANSKNISCKQSVISAYLTTMYPASNGITLFSQTSECVLFDCHRHSVVCVCVCRAGATRARCLLPPLHWRASPAARG